MILVPLAFALLPVVTESVAAEPGPRAAAGRDTGGFSSISKEAYVKQTEDRLAAMEREIAAIRVDLDKRGETQTKESQTLLSSLGAKLSRAQAQLAKVRAASPSAAYKLRPKMEELVMDLGVSADRAEMKLHPR